MMKTHAAIAHYDSSTLSAEALDLLRSLIAIPSVSRDETKAADLANRFVKNFVKYTGNEAGKALVAAGPEVK